MKTKDPNHLIEKVKAALPHLTEEEIMLCEKDCMALATVCAMNGLMNSAWQQMKIIEGLCLTELRNRKADMVALCKIQANAETKDAVWTKIETINWET